MLMAPLLFAVMGLLLDLVNFVVPVPDLFKLVMDAISPLIDAPDKVPFGRWFYIAAMAAIPGVIVMGLIVLALGRVLREATLSDAGNFTVRAPDATILAEQRFANVVAEMAVAANLPAPRVFIIQSDAANAAAFGQDAATRRSRFQPGCSTGSTAPRCRVLQDIWSDRSPMETWQSARA